MYRHSDYILKQLNHYEKHYFHTRVDETKSDDFPLRARLFAIARDSRSRATLTIGSRSRCRVAKSHGQEPEAQGGHAVTVGIRRERVPTSARTNDLCKCSICYPCLLSFLCSSFFSFFLFFFFSAFCPTTILPWTKR